MGSRGIVRAEVTSSREGIEHEHAGGRLVSEPERPGPPLLGRRALDRSRRRQRVDPGAIRESEHLPPPPPPPAQDPGPGAHQPGAPPPPPYGYVQPHYAQPPQG